MAALQRENEAWGQRQSTLAAQMNEIAERLQQSQAAARDFEQRGERAERQAAELACQLDNQQQLADKLRKRRFVSLEREVTGDSRSSFSFREMRMLDQGGRKDDEHALSVHPELGKVYDIAPPQPDDLKKIPGIADRVEEQLHSLGIYTYRQLMEWNHAIIDEIARRLELGDLIQRHDWVGNARRLYHENERNAA